MNYDHLTTESTWKKFWEEREIYKTEDVSSKPKYYVLDMFPYPSGMGLHVGHPRGYIASDVLARSKRMQGFNVLHPMGFDSFGLPAEQYAIKTGNHPGPYTDELVAHYKKQLENIGFSYDWSREVATHKPEYYKWTQWIFIQLFNSWYNPETNKAEPIETCVEMLRKQEADWNSKTDLEKQEVLMKYRLAYEGYAEVNWCEEMQTVLANDEIVTAADGSMVSERGEYPVVKKSMRQWFMRITAYADRLLTDIEPLDWPSSIKEIQKNWIGKSEGAEIDFSVVSTSSTTEMQPVPEPVEGSVITVFTTRADTLFGVTYVVLAPEHKLVSELKDSIKNYGEVEEYLKKVKATSEDDRINDKKEKTGICLEGVFAKNPANGELIPVWIADYVLASYGTGAVMAVPAHDERDFEFAKKYDLPMKNVIDPLFVTDDIKDFTEFKVKNKVVCVVESPTGEILTINWKPELGGRLLAAGTVEEGEKPEETALRELAEETGYYDAKVLEVSEETFDYKYFAHSKNQAFQALTKLVHIKLNSLDKNEPQLEENEKGKFEIEWVSKDIVQKEVKSHLHVYAFEKYVLKKAFTDEGISQRGATYSNGLLSTDARQEIVEELEHNKTGRFVTKFKMRDAIFARQRYWGEPIPLVYKKDGTIETLPENELPLVLPDLQDFAPAGNGQSPLSKSAEWVEKGYETNTMPGWAGSSWYFLRYMDPHNNDAFASKEAIDYWQDVDMYVGGAEHATGHLLYSRFWHKALFDLGFVTKPEPFKALRNQGMIGGTDGRKMSKRWGNVINPDDVVAQMGADTLRVYESFMGPFESHLPWSTDGIVGSRRFIEKLWNYFNNDWFPNRTTDLLLGNQDFYSSNEGTNKFLSLFNKTIKKVDEDINNFKFNTAISSLMILMNYIYSERNNGVTTSFQLTDFQMETVLKLLAPFAPYVTEELWHKLYPEKVNESIHTSSWPTYDETFIVDDEISIGIQINGKVRGDILVGINEDEESVKQKALSHENVMKWLEGKEPKKVIYVKGRIVSIVV